MAKHEYTTGWLCRDERRAAGWVTFWVRSKPRLTPDESLPWGPGRWVCPPRGEEAQWAPREFDATYDLFEADGTTPSPPIEPGQCFPADIEL